MHVLLRRLLAFWVKPDVRPESAPGSIGAVPGSPVCYVLERRRVTDLAVLENFCARHGLPRPSGCLVGREASAVRAAFPMLQARGYAEEIAANYSHAFITFMDSFLGRLWNRLYDGVTFSHAERCATSRRSAKSSSCPVTAVTWTICCCPT
jgi:glycerol-3-phosphate O-acyltransferase